MTAPRSSRADADAAVLAQAAAQEELRRPSGRAARRGLVIQTAWFGDVVLTTPLVRRAAERLGAPVDVITVPAAAPLLAGNPHVREVLTFDKKGADAGVRGLWRMAQRLRLRGYEVAYCAQASSRTAALAWLARIPTRIGFRGSRAEWLYSHTVLARTQPHAVERYLALADGAPDRREPEVFPSAADRAAADAVLAEAGVTEPFIAIAPGAAWATKRWPYFPELARALADDHPLALLGGPGDRPDARAILTALGRGATVADGIGRLALLPTAAVLRRATLLIANDSVHVHLASATHTPTVEIYGPTVPQHGFAARAPHSRLVEPDPLPCRPCSMHGPAICPLGHHKCMRETPISAVLAEVRTVLQIVRLKERGR
jgi:heptosyltransferase-2